MTLPKDVRVQLAFGLANPLTDPDECFIDADAAQPETIGYGTAWTGTVELDYRVDIQMADYSVDTQEIIYRKDGLGNKHSIVRFDLDGKLEYLFWTGSTLVTLTCPVPVRALNGQRIAIRLRRTHGSGIYSYHWYQAPAGSDLESDSGWTYIGSNYSTTAHANISGVVGLGAEALDVDLKYFGWVVKYNGSTVLKAVNFPAGVTSFVDEQNGAVTWDDFPNPTELNAEWVTVDDDRVISVNCMVGRTDDNTNVEATSATFVLDNHDRTFDPDWTSGPYAGLLVPRIPIRIQYYHSSAWVTLWTGFVESYHSTWQYPSDGMIRIEAVDVLGIVADISITRDRFQDLILKAYPDMYFTFDAVTPDGFVPNVAIAPVSDDITITNVDEVTDVQSILPNKSGKAINANPAGTAATLEVTAPAGTDIRPFVFMFWMKLKQDRTKNRVIVQEDQSGTVAYTLYVTTSGRLRLDHTSGRYRETTVSYDNDKAYFVVVSVSSTGVVTFDVNGISPITTASSPSTFSALAGAGQLSIGSNYLGSDSMNEGAIQDFAYFSNEFSGSELDSFHGAAIGSRTTNLRLLDIMTSGNLPIWLRNVVGVSLDWDGPATRSAFGSPYMLDALASTIATEQGWIYVNHVTHKITCVPRDFRTIGNAWSPGLGATVSDDPTSSTDIRASQIERIPSSLDSIINVVELTWAGATLVFQDAASVERYGPRRRQINAEVTSRAQAQEVANTIFTRHAQPTSRLASVIFDLSTDPDNADLPVTVVPNAYLDCSFQPLGLGTRSTETYWVNGVEHALQNKEWRMKVSLTPRLS